ncbi:unnamed protein product [Linum tenue]|uniref:GTD-binding domain-containing protein n=1 Tax=Linum tenue TaxID=586396 RepID=A0AAV0S5U8_9ROSI|nr:unnamed protein product [Linum tenue]
MAGNPCQPGGFYEHSTLWTDELGIAPKQLLGHLNEVLAIARVNFLPAPKRVADNVVKHLNTIRNLEQAPEAEKVARASLYQELEERVAAASAADEAMAMILLLQEENASLKMELRQSHTMVEETFSCDEEEMNVLQEILIRRERHISFP